MGLWGSVSCNGVTQCWPAQGGQAIVPRSSPYMVYEKWIQACTATDVGTLRSDVCDFLVEI